ncbi:beta strand repeat-containing protein [Candidatus Omnitrophota bacterium]
MMFKRNLSFLAWLSILIGLSVVVYNARAGTLEFDGVPVDITTTASEDLVIVPGTGGNTQIGDALGTNTNATSNDDVHVTGEIESDGEIYADSGITAGSDIVSDNDSTDSLGSSNVAWINLYVDVIQTTAATNLTLNPATTADLILLLDSVGSTIMTGFGQNPQVTLAANLDQDDVLIKRDVDGSASYSEAGSLLRLERDVTNASAETGVHLEFADSDTTLPAQLLNSTVANTASAVAFELDTATALTTAGAKLLSIKTGGTEKFYVDKDGTTSSTGSVVTTGIRDVDGDTQVQVEETSDEDIIRFDTAGNQVASIDATGDAIFQTSTDSTTGFQILDADGGTPILNVDTTNERVGIGTVPSTYDLDVNGHIRVAGGGSLFFGGSANTQAKIRPHTPHSQLAFAVGTLYNNAFVFTDMINANNNHDHAQQTNPTIFIHSATDPDSDNTQWMSLAHDQTNAVFGLGTGAYTFPDGNVGIGTTGPGTLLELSSTAPYLTLWNSTEEDTEGGRESQLIFEGEQSGGEQTSLAIIQASHDGTSDDEKGDLIFYVNDGDDGASPTEGMRLDSAGDLTVAGSISGTLSGYVKTDGTTPMTADWDIGDALMIQADKIQARDGAGLSLFEDGGAGIFVEDGGQVGIGTAGPNEKLEVNGNARITDTSGANTYINMVDSTGEVAFGNNGDAFQVAPGQSTLAGAGIRLIAESGGVGINTSSLESGIGLTIDKGSSTANSWASMVALRRTTIGTAAAGLGGGYDFFIENDNDDNEKMAQLGAVMDDTTDGDERGYLLLSTRMEDDTSPQERMRIDPDGNVGIGTTGPDAILDVTEDAADATVNISAFHDTEATTPLLTMRKADNTEASPDTIDLNAVLGTVNFDGYDDDGFDTGASIYAKADANWSATERGTALYFQTRDANGALTDQMTIAADGTVTFAGTVGVDSLQDDDGDTMVQVEESADEDIIRFDTAGNEVASIDATGDAIFQPSTDSATGFQVLDANGGTPVFNVDTDDERVGIGTAAPSRTLDVNGTSTFTGELQLDDGSANSPAIEFMDETNDFVDLYKLDGGDLVCALYGDSGDGLRISLFDRGGVGATNDKTRILFTLEEDGGNGFKGAEIQAILTDATDTEEDMELAFVTSIDGTRSEAVRIDNNGSVGIGTTGPDAILDVTEDAANATVNISAFHDTEATTPLLTLRKADNTEAAPATIDLNAVLGTVNFDGYDDDSFDTGASIYAKADANWSGTERGTALYFQTRDANGALTDQMTIAADGTVTFAGSVGVDSLQDDDGDTQVQVEESADEDIIRFDTAGNQVASIDATGDAIFQPSTDSATGFQVLDANGGTPVFNVDTDNERVGCRR